MSIMHIMRRIGLAIAAGPLIMAGFTGDVNAATLFLAGAGLFMASLGQEN